MTGRPPACAHCELGIRPCAPCCRHTGWVHRHDGSHQGPDGHFAVPRLDPAATSRGYPDSWRERS